MAIKANAAAAATEARTITPPIATPDQVRRRPTTRYVNGRAPAELTRDNARAHTDFGPRTPAAGLWARSARAQILKPTSTVPTATITARFDGGTSRQRSP